jgi:hypothetical protein
MGNKQHICYDEKTTFVGQIKNDTFHGEGTLYYNDTGDLYKGTFKNGLTHGYGEMHFYNGNTYIGDFYEGQMHGKGTYINNNGYIYEGNFIVGCLLGEGKLFDVNGELLYEGEFLNSLPHGFGLSYSNGKVNYVGRWNQNLYHGYGLLIENGVEKYGLFHEGSLVEQINKIPKKFYKYVTKKQVYDSDINLTKYVNTKLNYVFPQVIPEPSAPPLVVENPFNHTLGKPVLNFNNENKPFIKTTFNPLTTRSK